LKTAPFQVVPAVWQALHWALKWLAGFLLMWQEIQSLAASLLWSKLAGVQAPPFVWQVMHCPAKWLAGR
jgi:hypothetical protein